MEKLVLALMAVTVIVSGCVDSTENGVEPGENSTNEEPETNNSEETDNETNNVSDGSNENNETTDASESSNESVDRTVTIQGGPGIAYNVSELSFEEGETVEFVYTHAGGNHDLVLESPEGNELESTEVYSEEGATESFTYTFDSSGDYMFYCSVGTHRAQGMEGTITVE